MQNTTAVTDVTALFVGPELLEIPSAAERNGYKKKKGDSDTTQTKDEIVT